MGTYFVNIHLQIETTFGRGDGLAGVLDQEVIYDKHGFPYLYGRTLKGLLSEEIDGIAWFLSDHKRWDNALQRLFGVAGSDLQTQAIWQYGDAYLPEDLRKTIAIQVQMNKYFSKNLRTAVIPPDQFKAFPPISANDVLDSLTTTRAQTAIQAVSGTPDEGSLRTARVIVRDLVFQSRLSCPVNNKDDLMLLAAGCAALRHIGSGRTRGRGRVICSLLDAAQKDITMAQLEAFEEVTK